ncbi:MAG: 50S ribosomal protein L13 [Patescibacteria group bacterium]|nr:50S ribosomal protein L13 [Patescibacteria group bacterium]MCL5093813.1 50S ribosomal protein L13 [Patescibacteria group bacterium]
MKTFVTKEKNIERKWYLLDAKDVTLGKLAVKAADLLRGKGKGIFSPSVDCGDYVIIINTDKVKVTGNKEEKKIYYSHSWYPGGLKSLSFKELKEKDSRKIVFRAVKGMLPKNKLSNDIIGKLKVYKGEEHANEAQKPIKIEIKGV